MPDQKPVLLYDGNCGFCKIWIRYWQKLTDDRVEYEPSQDARDRYPQIPSSGFSEAVQLVRPDGSVASGALAVFETLGRQKTYAGSRIVRGLSELAYRVIAKHRSFFYHLTRLTFGTQIEPARFSFTQSIFFRLLAIVYACAFASLAVQITGLIGARGILPVEKFLKAASQAFGGSAFLKVPTIFWWNASDGILRGACWAGVAISALLFAGFFRRIALILLFVLYLSLSSAGQDFLSFQWDSLLLEAGFLAIFLGRSQIVVWLFRWLVFRLNFLSGSVKLLSHDPTWRNLTALNFHYHTQPLPNVLAWYADRLPAQLQHFSTLMVLVIEIGAPFLIFAPRRLRLFGASCLIGLQILILWTGNYAFFNLLTIALCLFLFDDQFFRRSAAEPRPSASGRALAAILTALILTLSLSRMSATFTGEAPEPLRTLESTLSPFQIVSSYGLFAVMTTSRPEIIVEGSDDGENWLAYEFRYKPGDLLRAPRFVAPHQPRLDWQMWFAALSSARENSWFMSFAVRLMEGSPPVLALLEKNPFPDHPPRYLRAMAYEYTFTNLEQRRQTGAWWKRELLGTYLPPVGLRRGVN